MMNWNGIDERTSIFDVPPWENRCTWVKLCCSCLGRRCLWRQQQQYNDIQWYPIPLCDSSIPSSFGNVVFLPYLLNKHPQHHRSFLDLKWMNTEFSMIVRVLYNHLVCTMSVYGYVKLDWMKVPKRLQRRMETLWSLFFISPWLRFPRSYASQMIL